MPAPKPKGLKPISGDVRPRVLIVADNGWGKTRFTGTAPKLAVASFDPEGSSSIFFGGGRGDKQEIQSVKDWEEFFAYFARGNGCNEYDWLSMDTATEFQRVIMGDRLKNRPVQGKQEQLVAAQADYLVTQLQFIDYVKAVNDLPINVIWTAQVMELDNWEGERQFFPAIHGQKGDLARTFRGYMNIVGAGETLGDESDEEAPRRLHFRQALPYMGKDRFDALGAYQDDLTIPKMMRLIEAKKAEVSGAARPVRKTSTTAKKKTTATRRPAAG